MKTGSKSHKWQLKARFRGTRLDGSRSPPSSGSGKPCPKSERQPARTGCWRPRTPFRSWKRSPLRWLVEGYGYEITSDDVLHAYSFSMKAAENAGRVEETRNRIRGLVMKETFGERFVTRVLGSRLGLSL